MKGVREEVKTMAWEPVEELLNTLNVQEKIVVVEKIRPKDQKRDRNQLERPFKA